MKRLILILGIVLIITLSVVWGYLLFFGTPESASNFFANFDFGNSEEVGVVETFPEVLSEEGVGGEVLALSQLRQLTTKPVVGYTEVTATTSSSTFVYYIEAGTGHIYSLDTITGAEIRLSNITVPNAKKGLLTADGSKAAIQAGDPGTGDLTIIELLGGVDSSRNLKVINNVYSFSLSTDAEVLFTTVEREAHRGFSYNIQTDTTKTIFSLPFTQATIVWGDTASAKHYFFPKPESQLEGYLYSTVLGSIAREPLSGFGFSAQTSPVLHLSSHISDGEYISVVLDPITGTSVESAIDFIPEKCFISRASTGAVCAIHSQIKLSPDTIGNWHKGVLKTNDTLFFIKYQDGILQTTNFSSIDFFAIYNIDMENITIPVSERGVYFQNKLDRSLWFYSL